MLRLHCLQHDPFSGPGSIQSWAGKYGHELSRTLLYEDELCPLLESFDWLFILGGPMNIYEEERYPWLIREKEFIRRAIAAGKTVIGLCLGAQLIADVTGGQVTANPQPETGWLPVRWTEAARENPLLSGFPEISMVLEWHADTFSILPPEAAVLAGSAACRHQMFVYRERVFGFQFHLEVTAELLRQMITEYGEATGTGAAEKPSPERMLDDPEYIEQNNRWMAEFLNRLMVQAS
jgi:GMP synthase-like glutamine amidotransferase